MQSNTNKLIIECFIFYIYNHDLHARFLSVENTLRKALFCIDVLKQFLNLDPDTHTHKKKRFTCCLAHVLIFNLLKMTKLYNILFSTNNLTNRNKNIGRRVGQ